MILPEYPRFSRSRIRKNAGRPLITRVLANAATMGVSFWSLLFFSLLLKAEEFKLDDGDRVVLIGSTLIEREQETGYWETALTSRFPKANLTFRNLGWSGDTVFCDARAMFESPAVGLQHLKEDLARLKPTVIILGYGTNESFEGEAGLGRFRQGLGKLFLLAGTKAPRIVVLGPPQQEKLARPVPDPAKHNHDLELYREALQHVSSTFGFLFLDLRERSKPEIRRSDLPWTDNGIHFTDFGYWRSAAMLERSLCGKREPWLIEIDKDATIKKTEGVQVSKAQSGTLRFETKDVLLPTPAPPLLKSNFKKPSAEVEGRRVLQVTGLSPGKYSLRIDGQEAAVGSTEEWAAGVTLIRGPEFDQVEKLRQAIVEKNRLFFHRWRPQNETYIYGFRKHEQGQNAREIPEFDPLIIQLEKKIAELRVPVPHQYELTAEAQRHRNEK